MNCWMKCVSAAMLLGMAGTALAQPTITSLGSGTPIGVSSLTGGSYYVSGSGIVTTQVGRWMYTPSASTIGTMELGGASAGYPAMSADGAFMVGLFPNSAPQIFGNTATGVSPIFSTTPTLVASTTAPGATETIANRWSSSTSSWSRLAPFPTETRLCFGQSAGGVHMMTFGSGSSGGSTGAFLDANAISQNGRYVVGFGYPSSYSTSAGTTITANVFRWHPYIWDAQTNTTTVLPTAARTSSNTWRPRTARAYAVSNDGQVVVGYQEHNVSSSLALDPDGARPLVWRWNSMTSQYDMAYLPTGKDGSNQVYTASATAGSIFINAAGTVIVGRNIDDTGSSYICKWTWDAGTSTWNTTNIGTNVGVQSAVNSVTCPVGTPTVTTAAPHGLSVGDKFYLTGTTTTGYNGMWKVSTVINTTTFEFTGPDDSPKACAADSLGGSIYKAASWLPPAVTNGCGPTSNFGAPPSVSVTGMSDDGNTIVGSATYSTCGSFMTGGWIWHAADGTLKDWYDYCVSQNVPGVATYYAPIDANAQPVSIGLPRLGNPTGISADGTAIVGRQGGTQIVVPSAGPWIFVTSGGSACVAPAFTIQPAASQSYSLCNSLGVILNVSVSGTAPFTIQWFKDGSPLVNGPTVHGSTIAGADSAQLRITTPRGLDAGTYTCVVTGCNGQTATTGGTVLTPDAAAANDTCATATNVGEGTTTFNPCGAYVNDGASTCLTPSTTEIGDVWFRYTPTFTGEARFQTCASAFNTTLQVYDACNGGVLACNDDVGPRGLAGIGAACSSTRSVISRMNVVSGVSVLVRVGIVGSASATGSITISQAPALPAGDTCENPVSVDIGTTAFNLNEATDQFTFGTEFCSTPLDNTLASNRDLFFLLNSPCGGTYTISTCGSTMTNPMLHIISDCAGGVSVCDDNVGSGVSGCTSNQARIENLVTTGPVIIRVSQSGTGSPGTAATSGAGNLVITGTSNVCASVCCRGATCSLTTAGNCTVASGTAGATFVGGNTTCNVTGNATSPCCYADYNKTSGITIQDIFDFLNDWFAASPYANTGGDGTTPPPGVQSIFDFLNAWFAGGC